MPNKVRIYGADEGWVEVSTIESLMEDGTQGMRVEVGTGGYVDIFDPVSIMTLRDWLNNVIDEWGMEEYYGEGYGEN
jgi:hypothetical protein